ncbi:uncharacterized protein LOC122695588 isoform X2 [Cervus elaphus]|uniref:uncharacterized protein LOC122430966 isoform X2 n=1 Tax=Cervus canadensis TaxID=1574408 RepID=UPI001C9E5344|nr:uncharacterized protein LOC122430966 isoform X2 [Cervus canadensis]XP_043761606.1 uncharacterized protein LOC122695588 isoform X2 [Cervus elaphus]
MFPGRQAAQKAQVTVKENKTEMEGNPEVHEITALWSMALQNLEVTQDGILPPSLFHSFSARNCKAQRNPHYHSAQTHCCKEAGFFQEEKHQALWLCQARLPSVRTRILRGDLEVAQAWISVSLLTAGPRPGHSRPPRRSNASAAHLCFRFQDGTQQPRKFSRG